MKQIKKILNKQGVAGYVFIMPFIIGMIVFTLIPFGNSFYLAFTKYDVLTEAEWIGLGNFEKMFFHDDKFWIALGVTFKFTAIQVPVKLGFSLLVALLLSRPSRTTGLFRTIFYIPSIMGGSVAVALLWKQLFNYNGVINKILGVVGIEPVAWLNETSTALYVLMGLGVWQFGSSMLIFLAAIKNIPSTYYEAARIDGAGKFACFFKVTLPMISPVLFFNLINQIIGSLQAFNSSYLITDGGPLNSTLYYGLHLYNRAFKYYEMGYGAAMAWFLLVIIAGLTALVFKSSSAWVYYEEETGMKKLKLAIIGQGRSGRGIHGAFYKSEANDIWKVEVVVELDELRRKRAKEEYPGCEVYSDYRELFGRTDLDLVVNDTYSDLHYDITKDLLEHGFNVLVEKPMARSFYECSNLIRIAKEHQVLLAVFQQSFLAPFYIETKKILDSGKIGDVVQVNLNYSGMARRWDWQTLQCRVAGNTYNTGPHPIGLALDFLEFSPETKVIYSKLGRFLTSGDADDYAKIVMTAPGRPVVDIEISSVDAYSDYTLKIQGSKGTYVCTPTDYKLKYIVDGENVPRPVVRDFLQDAEGYPIYPREELITHEERGGFDGTAFNVAVERFYRMVYEAITEGRAMEVTAEKAAQIVAVIELVHAQNPMTVLY